MIRTLFLSMGELNKGPAARRTFRPRACARSAWVGAGFMGAGVAYVTAQAGSRPC